jgi:Lar family restriction alleviation protein
MNLQAALKVIEGMRGHIFNIHQKRILRDILTALCSEPECSCSGLREQEHCEVCGRGYYPIVWRAPQDLWCGVTGHSEGGLYCPDCFAKAALKLNKVLYWECAEDEFPLDAMRSQTVTSPKPEKPADSGHTLKPCPFCGGEAEVILRYKENGSDIAGYDVGCGVERCNLQEGADWYRATPAEAIAAWNRRAEDIDSVDRLRVQLKAKVNKDGEIERTLEIKLKQADYDEDDAHNLVDMLGQRVTVSIALEQERIPGT